MSVTKALLQSIYLNKANRGQVYWLSKQFDIEQYEEKKWKYHPDKIFLIIKECPCLQWCTSHQLYWFMTATYSTINQNSNFCFWIQILRWTYFLNACRFYPLVLIQNKNPKLDSLYYFFLLILFHRLFHWSSKKNKKKKIF